MLTLSTLQMATISLNLLESYPILQIWAGGLQHLSKFVFLVEYMLVLGVLQVHFWYACITEESHLLSLKLVSGLTSFSSWDIRFAMSALSNIVVNESI